MLQFFKAGLVAAARQFAAIIVVTLMILLLAPREVIVHEVWPTGNHPPGFCSFVSSYLAWAYILTATALALTESHSVKATAERIRHASRLISSAHGPATLGVPLVLSAILFAVFAFRTPPRLLIEIVQYLGIACAAPAVWTGIISIGVACFGASAHAAIRAL